MSMDFFQVGSRQSAITNHDSTGYPNMADPVVVAHNEISGTTWCQRRQLEAKAFGSEPIGSIDSRIDNGLDFSVLGSLGSQDARFLLHAGRVAVGSDRHLVTLAEGRGIAHTVAKIRARVLNDP
jgi:hypothetical protein